MAKAESLFSAAEMEAISASIKAVETGTAGEIAVMVVDRSDTYPEGILLGGLVIGALAALVVTDLAGYTSQWVYVPCAALGIPLAGLALKMLPFLHRLFVPGGRLEDLVRRRAEQAFYEKGLHRTRDASGVLFFLSCFERKVWVLADSGIYRKISPASLQVHADNIVKGVKQGRPAQALCDEIAAVGEVLARHFPIKSDDINELPNEVIVERSTRP